MQLLQNYSAIKERHRGCVLSIGNFDGVHLGHQQLLSQLTEKARRLNLPAVVMLFEPQPLEFLRPLQAPKRLMSFRDKCCHLAKHGIDYVYCMRFKENFAELSAEKFIQQILIDKLAVRHLVVGEDFQFGKKRQGGLALLLELATLYNFEVQIVNDIQSQGTRISSTAIRDVLLNGDIAQAEQLLGHPYTVTGHIVTGRALGRTIGFPTVNLNVLPNLALKYGVYAVEIIGVSDKPKYGVANIGVRPTIDSNLRPLLEVHLFDFDQDVYGKLVQVRFRKKIRDEQHFDSLNKLKQQIDNDVKLARAMLLTD